MKFKQKLAVLLATGLSVVGLMIPANASSEALEVSQTNTHAGQYTSFAHDDYFRWERIA